MRRIFEEWLAIRRRVRGEREFHLERGGRFGRASRQAALRELGGDWRGLAALLRAAMLRPAVPGVSAWPLGLLLAWFALLLVSPSARLTVESVAGAPAPGPGRDSLFVSVRRNETFAGLTDAQFAALRSSGLFATLDSFEGRHGRGVPRFPGRELADGLRLVDPSIAAIPLYQRTFVPMALPRAGWLGGIAVALVLTIGSGWRLALYGAAVLGGHAWLSLTLWAVLYQWWRLGGWSTSGRGALALALAFAVCIWVAAWQWAAWRNDLRLRCPQCLSRLRMPLDMGVCGGMLTSTPVRELICSRGHGTLAESRWERTFREPAPFLRGLMR